MMSLPSSSGTPSPFSTVRANRNAEMETRCCTPPSHDGNEEGFFSSCRYRLFENEEDVDGLEIKRDGSLAVRPSVSLPRPSGSCGSTGLGPNEKMDILAPFPSPQCLPRSPRQAFHPITINLSGGDGYGRTAFQGRSGVGEKIRESVASTPWKPALSSAAPSGRPSDNLISTSANASMMAHLQTPEAQRATYALAPPGAISHLLYTPKIAPLCQAWRANLDAELDGVGMRWMPDQMPPATPLIENALYVGGFPDAAMIPLLHSLGIRHIINCCVQDVCTTREVREHFCVHSMESFDTAEYLILHRDYEEFAKLVSTILANGERVFVHCIAGVNRSITLCAAYLMDHFALNPVEAVRVIRRQGRQHILENRGFRHQLVDHYLQSVDARSAECGLP